MQLKADMLPKECGFNQALVMLAKVATLVFKIVRLPNSNYRVK